jgi:hypothetical protein
MTGHTEEKILEYLSTIAAALEDIRRDIHELVDERPTTKDQEVPVDDAVDYIAKYMMKHFSVEGMSERDPIFKYNAHHYLKALKEIGLKIVKEKS